MKAFILNTRVHTTELRLGVMKKTVFCILHAYVCSHTDPLLLLVAFIWIFTSWMRQPGSRTFFRTCTTDRPSCRMQVRGACGINGVYGSETIIMVGLNPKSLVVASVGLLCITAVSNKTERKMHDEILVMWDSLLFRSQTSDLDRALKRDWVWVNTHMRADCKASRGWYENKKRGDGSIRQSVSRMPPAAALIHQGPRSYSLTLFFA